MDKDDFIVKRCRYELCGKLIYPHQEDHHGYCSTDCVSDARQWKGRNLDLRINGGKGLPVAKKHESIEDAEEEPGQKLYFPHRLYPDTLLVL